MNIFVNVEDAKRLGLIFLIEYGRKNIKDDNFCASFLGKFGNAYPVIPDQSGLGNYDYDYANNVMIKDVKMQMLFQLYVKILKNISEMSVRSK